MRDGARKGTGGDVGVCTVDVYIYTVDVNVWCDVCIIMYTPKTKYKDIEIKKDDRTVFLLQIPFNFAI